MRIHLLQHVNFESGGFIENWIKENNHSLTVTRFFKSENLPPLNEIDWLIIMGGPMGVYDEDKYPWLKDEKQFIASAIKAGKTVLGICLGSQLIADALGAKIYPNKFKEIGWFPISLTDEGRNNYFVNSIQDKQIVFHWHGDTFDLPEGAIHLAKSAGCLNQAFVSNEKVVGLQFHLEVTEKSLKDMIENGKNEIREAKYIQNENGIYEGTINCEKNNSLLNNLLNRLAENFSCKTINFPQA